MAEKETNIQVIFMKYLLKVHLNSLYSTSSYERVPLFSYEKKMIIQHQT